MLFSEKMKLADMMLASSKLLYVFPRFGVRLGFGEKSVSDICSELEISMPLFLQVCNVYTNPDYLPEIDDLRRIELPELIAYLRNSHSDYLKLRIANLRSKIMKVANGCDKNCSMLLKFFDGYVNEVVKHFSYEEKTVFPYVEKLVAHGPQAEYNIGIYEKNHTDIEEKLDDLKNILIKYVPESDQSVQREALRELFLFEEDLNRHALIEDRILVPLVMELEKGDGRYGK
ncbi:MAG: hemerythrin domain-containing protein [Paludibacteraceae bacterium]|nr:hemerythrin domain-containing protein [Paludibacteraceae bacterium]